MAHDPDPPGPIRRLWTWFWTPSAVLSVGFTLIVGFLAGILFWGGFHWSLELTNTEEFCTSCHTMETNLGEYHETVHYNNHSGMRAICSDCHGFDYMDFTLQEGRAASEHQRAIDTGMTCIDCHQGIAHNLPAGHLDEYKRVVDDLVGQTQEDTAAVQSYLQSNAN